MMRLQDNWTMPVNTCHILVIDGEYLIAMDVELILTRALNCEVTICTPYDYESVLGENRFDIALVDTGEAVAKFVVLFETVRVHCAAIVVSTSCEEYSAGVPGVSGYPVVLKPYDEAALIEAIMCAADRNPAGTRSPVRHDTSITHRNGNNSVAGFASRQTVVR